ncbi:hypothetical protein DEM91_12755 [Prevotella sp. TCVGH]|nr:hypothetical protein [Prevotella sp. TCVGH]
MSRFVYQVVTSEVYLYYKKGEASCFVLKIAASQGMLFFISLHREKTHKKLNIFFVMTQYGNTPL